MFNSPAIAAPWVALLCGAPPVAFLYRYRGSGDALHPCVKSGSIVTLPHQQSLPQLLYLSFLPSHIQIMFPIIVVVAATTWQHNLLALLLPPISPLPTDLRFLVSKPIPTTTPTFVVFTIYAHSTDFLQAVKVAKASAKAAPSVTARSSVTTSRALPSPPSAVSPVVVVSSVSLPVCSSNPRTNLQLALPYDAASVANILPQ